MSRILPILKKSGIHRLRSKHTPLCTRLFGSIYEPDYLKLLEPEHPSYPTMNIQMKGYDFTTLEHYAKYIAKTARNLDITVDLCYPIPGKKVVVESYLPGTTTRDQEYKLTLHERNVRISDLTSVVAPTFIEVIQNSLPAGVRLSIHENTEELDNQRFIPDLELLELREQLDTASNKPKS